MNRFFSMLLSITTFSVGAVINVPSDYSTIQAGINASNDGDTVLVAQGNYIENLILEKEIVLASHAIYDNLGTDWISNEHVANTKIIGGSPTNTKKGSCIQVSYGNIQPTIMGFTVSNGLGTSMIVDDCGISRIERSGGAIMAFQAYPILSYNRFIGNGAPALNTDNALLATQSGGAITLYDDDDVEFDEDRNVSEGNSSGSRNVPDTWNVQNNYFEDNSSGNGENVYAHGYSGTIDVSGSIFEDIDCEQSDVNEFVLHSVEDEAVYLTNDISGACLDQDVFFVNPNSGDDENGGTEENPFKTIRHALTMIKSSDASTTIINLSAGRFSTNDNGEIFPIVLPDNVHLIGDEMETTILDADADENNESGVIIIPECENVKVANMTLRRGYSESHGCSGGGALLVTADDTRDLTWDMKTNNAILENLILENSHSKNGGGLSLFRVDGPVIENLIVRNNTATMMGGGINIYSANFSMEDVEIHDNLCFGTVYAGINDVGHGGGLFLNQTWGTMDNMNIHHNTASMNGGGVWSSEGSAWTMTNSNVSDNIAPYNGGGFGFWNHNGEDLNATLINVTIENNIAQPGWFVGHGGGVWASNSSTVFQDCIIKNNTAGGNGGGINYFEGGWPELYNCVIDGNSSNAIGGGVYIHDEGGWNNNGLTMDRCLVTNNSSNQWAGAISSAGNAGINRITNSTIVGNSGGGAAVEAYNASGLEVFNSIIWGNSPSNFDNQYGVTFGDGFVSHSNIGGGWEGDGNISSNPLFNNMNSGDYTLRQDSPCKDAGIADLDGDGVEDVTDYNGSAPDMGAYEMVMAAPSGLVAYPEETYVMLTWDPAVEEGLQYYLLERSTGVEFTENVISNYVMTNYYEDNSLEYDTEYFYRISYFNGSWSEVSDPVSVTLEFMSVENNQLPEVFALHQNYPNPFNPVTNLSYDLPEDAMVNITIFDMMGKMVASLVNSQQSAGFKTLQWDATNQSGMPISAGLYIYTIQAGEFNQTRKMILLK
ncbi:MAG: DUF1565 domain-containing protein [Candidatus Neomarinimicrobiota bacterium]